MSGFGAGFGNNSNNGFGGGGGGFGQAPFGSPPAAAPAAFGGSSPFGGGGGFGNSAASPTAFAAPASFAGNTNNTGGFGSSSNTASGFGGGGGGFGAPSPGPSFGGGGFGSNNNNNSPNNSGGGFGSPFVSSPQPNNNNNQSMVDVPNPFGSSTGAPSPAVTFGSSSNVAMSNAPAPMGGFGGNFSSGFGNNNSGGFGGGGAPFGSNSNNNPNPFGGGPSASSSGMTFGAPASAASHRRSNSVEMGGSESPTPMNAFGGGQQSSSSPFASGGGGAGAGVGVGGSLSPIPEDTMGDASNTPFGGGANNNSSSTGFGSVGFGSGFGQQPKKEGGGGEKEQELAKLKAKLEAKKKKLLEKQKKKEEANSSNSDNNQGQPQGQGQRERERKQPRDRDNHRDNRDKRRDRNDRNDPSRSSSPAPQLDDEQKARAERNAARFATNTNSATQSFMPRDLRGQTSPPRPSASSAPSNNKPKASVTSAVGGDANREDLSNAKSLVGTCQYMCPDEELLRRERENDIQLMEIPDPGGTHPPGWTLRNTAVTRFRRSAADYKLDVPEWVRPPDVLEQVCSYLEEWVMERDRQGPDRRYPQNGTPSSMDLYQFIWDRTRMIRKDFILQNFVGTGGACDARAVRCHERIARWHAMCEHQLSHINDFVVMQSQQNIQELGQAMKTLNQYYDDSLGRALVEVPDEQGRETRTNPTQFAHGCKANAVQGVNPVDYDGSPLNNTADIAKLPAQRLIGKEGANSPARGTAEPEMRGLYILLTMNNDGGMEVMNYSAVLYRERPEIYHSKPVQLALDIFKAKKDYNYVRFFRLLKDPNTPYLFSCLMFKHVEYFRKIAIRIMSKTYGAKKNGEPIYDAYPLKRLAHVLCFEDMDEARAACKHYNITVKEVKVRSSSSGQTGLTEVVFWRHSDFKEPKDPVKGHTLPLRPRKMIRYIETKLKGATRLGVCRGEVSGEGAALSQLPPSRVPQFAPPGSVKAQSTPAVPLQPTSAPSMLPTAPVPAPAPDASEAAQANDLLQAQQEILRKQKEEEARKKLEEKKRKEEERKKAEQVRLAQEEEKRLERRRLRKEKEELMERQLEEKKKLEEERKRKEEEAKLRAQKEKEEKERAEAAAREAARLKAEEEKRQKLEEEARLEAEAEAREKERLEKLRQEEERRQREIAAEKNRQRLAELERIRQEEERKRLEELRAQEEERKRLEAIERQRAKELEERVNFARKLLLVRRFRQMLPREFLSRSKTEETIKRIDPTFCVATSPFSGDVMERELAVAKSAALPRIKPEVVDCRKILNRILSKETPALDVASMALSALCKDDDLMERVRLRSKKYRRKESGCVKATFLLKVAVILPEPEGLEEQSMYESIHTWLNRRLEYDETDTVGKTDLRGELRAEVRILFVKADSWSGPPNCDAALVVIPPSLCSGDWGCSRKVDAISAAFNCVDPSTPRVALVLGESFDSEYNANVNRFLAACIPTDAEEFPVVYPRALTEVALEDSLMLSLKSLIKMFSLEYPPLVEQVSVMRMASKCISDTLWVDSRLDSLESAAAALSALEKQLEEAGQGVAGEWSNWPADDFAGQRGLVGDYFGEGVHLPTSWSSLVFQDVGKSFISELQQSLQEGSVAQAIGPMLAKAPFLVQQECQDMLEQRHYRKCLQRALEYAASADETTIYLPMGKADEIVDESIQRVMENTGVPMLPLNTEADDEEDDLEDENILPPPTPALDAAETAIDDAGVFQKARDIFEISRTISPVPPPGGGSMALTPSLGNNNNNNTRTPGTVSPPPGVSSAGAKRSWVGMSIDDRPEEGLLSPLRSPSPYGGPGSAAKRARDASYSRSRPTRSRDQVESSAFTKKLQALLAGEATVDMDVGTTSLSRLVRDTPLLDRPGRSSGVEEIL